MSLHGQLFNDICEPMTPAHMSRSPLKSQYVRDIERGIVPTLEGTLTKAGSMGGGLGGIHNLDDYSFGGTERDVY